MAERPVRLRLSRAKGFDLHALSQATNGLPAVNVARPSRFGNPFRIGAPGPLGRTAIDAEGAVGFFVAMWSDPKLRAIASYPRDLTPLRGKNLACWCEADAPCHADVLLELANAEPAPETMSTEE